MSLENVSFIVFNGYYPKDDDYQDIEPFPHTEETKKLYDKAIEKYGHIASRDNEDVLEGVVRGEDGKFYAQLYEDGETNYGEL